MMWSDNQYGLLDNKSAKIWSETKEVMTMYSMRYVHGHIHVFDINGEFLFSADNEREAREELMNYEESAA